MLAATVILALLTLLVATESGSGSTEPVRVRANPKSKVQNRKFP